MENSTVFIGPRFHFCKPFYDFRYRHRQRERQKKELELVFIEENRNCEKTNNKIEENTRENTTAADNLSVSVVEQEDGDMYCSAFV